jgi:hypothetical protein
MRSVIGANIVPSVVGAGCMGCSSLLCTSEMNYILRRFRPAWMVYEVPA